MQDVAEKKIGFITGEQYQIKLEELLLKHKIMMVMITNNLVVRINRAKSLYREYTDLRANYSGMSYEERACIEDFTIVEEIVYHTRKCIDEMILALWMDKVGINEIDNAESKVIDCIRDYKRQMKSNQGGEHIISEFDAFSDFMESVNQISNSYKHSILDFSPVETDIAYDEQQSSFFSYTLKPKDSDLRLSAEEMIFNLEEMFNCFLNAI